MNADPRTDSTATLKKPDTGETFAVRATLDDGTMVAEEESGQQFYVFPSDIVSGLFVFVTAEAA